MTLPAASFPVSHLADTPDPLGLPRGRTRVKFCGLVRAQDVRIAASLGVDALGLVFYPRSPRLLSLDEARELRRHWPSWVAAVGLFVNAPPEQVRAYSLALGLDVVQFHGDEDPVACAASLIPDQPYWRAVRLREARDLITSVQTFPTAESFLLDAHSAGYGGSGQVFDWSLIPSDIQRSLIVSGGLDAERVAQAIDRLRPDGVDVSSGIQGADPRIKDARRMIDFMSAVAQADARLSERTL